MGRLGKERKPIIVVGRHMKMLRTQRRVLFLLAALEVATLFYMNMVTTLIG